MEVNNSKYLSEIPNKGYFSIGETSELCGVKPHVLRYWEQEFPMLTPVKRRGNRRNYQRKDVILIRQIKDLLYDKGFTIEGAKTQLGDAGSGQALNSVDKYKTFFTKIIENLELLAVNLEV